MTRDCTRAVVLIEKLFDGEASSEERRDAEAHLDACTDCRAHLEFLTSLSERAREIPAREPPEAYWQHLPRKILSRIEEERGRRARGFFRGLFAAGGLRWARGASAIALLASLVVVVAVGVRFRRESPGSAEPRATAEERAILPHSEETSEPAESSRAIESASARAEAPPPASPRSERAPEAEMPHPPMARDEKRASNAAQKTETESVHVADAARDRMESEDLRAQASPAPSAPAGESPSSSGSARERSARTSSRLNVRQAETRPPAAASAELSRIGSSSLADCSTFRDALSSWTVDGRQSESENEARKSDLLYQLARCSLDRYQQEGGEALRKTALEDGGAFLALEKEGRRADEIRAELEGIRPKKN